MNKEELKYKNKSYIDRGDYYLLSKEDAIAFVSDCKDEKINIIGIDAFYRIDEEYIQPSLENSIDFSSAGYTSVGDIYSYSIDFLNNSNKDLFFEIIC